MDASPAGHRHHPMSMLRCLVVPAGTFTFGRVAGQVVRPTPRMQPPPLGHILTQDQAMTQSLHLIGRIVSRRLRLRRRYAHPPTCTALRRLCPVRLLRTSDFNLVTVVATTLSATPCLPGYVRSARLAI